MGGKINALFALSFSFFAVGYLEKE